MNNFVKKWYKKILITAGALIVAFLVFYLYWNTASPESTCSSCHEIQSPTAMWAESGHRTLHCKECHGTALSEGFHSMYEKGMMVINHLTGSANSEVKMPEDQFSAVLENCKRCHTMEYTKWMAGGHSAPYSTIFTNEKHNKMVEPNADCLRCHGMFYKGKIEDLVTPVNNKGPWKIIDKNQESVPVIPCLTCHQIHRKQPLTKTASYSDPNEIFYANKKQKPAALFFDRYDKTHFETDDLPTPTIWEGERKVTVSGDPLDKICSHCHAPNGFHQAGTSDDKTPRGVHEGLSCLSCHDNHDNNAKDKCVDCHPGISNCNLDVTKMNTTYFDKKSPFDIHFVACKDCHPKGTPAKKS